MKTKISLYSGFLGPFALTMILGLGACQQESRPSRKDRAGQGKAAKDPSGASQDHLGKPFTLKEITPLVGLLADPKAFEGKTVRVQGVVVSHCHHKLAWFGLRADAKDIKNTLRVMTAPDFLVPKDVKHGATQASAEGVVQMKTVPEAHAKHLAKEHGLFGGEPDQVKGPQYVVSLRATGASFQ